MSDQISNNSELRCLFEEDQADRLPEKIDWEVVGPRDRYRELRVKALYEQGELYTGLDYYRAAMILQHADTSDDYLLAHEFSIMALAKGVKVGLWLAAASEDRFLISIGRQQRFGTQYQAPSPEEPLKLCPVDSKVTGDLRKKMLAP